MAFCPAATRPYSQNLGQVNGNVMGSWSIIRLVRLLPQPRRRSTIFGDLGSQPDFLGYRSSCGHDTRRGFASRGGAAAFPAGPDQNSSSPSLKKLTTFSKIARYSAATSSIAKSVTPSTRSCASRLRMALRHREVWSPSRRRDTRDGVQRSTVRSATAQPESSMP